jgi:hypothetical protein
MSTTTYVNTTAHSVAYVTDKLLLSLKEIILRSGLSPAKMASQWPVLESGVSAWINSKHLREIHLEIINPTQKAIVTRWDLEIIFGSEGTGEFFVDTEAIKYHIAKAGLVPITCEYRISVQVAQGAPNVDGWGECTLYSTAGLSRYSVGTTVGSNGIGVGLGYWGK